MAGHTSEKRWEDVSTRASNEVTTLINVITQAEEQYQQMLEIYNYAGGTAISLAELLFKEDIAARTSPDNVASQEEIDKATDLINAMTAAHQLYQAANNVAILQADRLTDMRRMV